MVLDPRAGVEAIVAAALPDVVTQAGSVMSPHAPVTQVAGGMRPARVASKGEAGAMMVAAGLGNNDCNRGEDMTVPSRSCGYRSRWRICNAVGFRLMKS